jgi:hypothetical protein
MKKIICFVAVVLFSSVLFYSCEKEDDFDEALLIGKWKPVSGTSLYFRYDRNHEGVTWNPSVDQREDEGQKFRWSLVQSELEQRHHIEIIGEDIIIEIYTVTELTETSLRYKNEVRSYTFSKIP